MGFFGKLFRKEAKTPQVSVQSLQQDFEFKCIMEQKGLEEKIQLVSAMICLLKYMFNFLDGFGFFVLLG